MIRAVSLALVWTLVLCCAGASEAGADARSEFRAGYLAFERKDWPEVERRMSAAISEQPAESARDLVRIGGTFSKAYLPWFYLGLARAELGQCAGAIEALDRSEAQGEVVTLREHETLVEVRRRCAETVAAAGGAAGDATGGAPPPAAREPVPTEPERPSVPAGLLEGATLFFAADYRGCLDELPRPAAEPTAVAAQIELFRAACEFALARAGDPSADERMTRARAAATRYRSLAAGAAPGPAYFSPDFLAFLLGR